VSMKKVLVVDNQMSTCDLLAKFLGKKGYEVETTTLGQNALMMLTQKSYDIIICDYRLPDIQGEELFDKVIQVHPQAAVIFMSREVNLRNAVDLIRRGAHNYLSKPLNPDELLSIIMESQDTTHAHGKYEKKELSKKMTTEVNHLDDYVFGKSEKAVEMINQVKKVGATNFTVIIEGETGTGKESLARLIHNESPRRNMPFIAVDCGSLSKEIAGSELFGHEKGAFTGAVSEKTGFFELAKGGTIFLDEIANLSLDIQMALLRALQEKVIRKIGGVKEIGIDVRIIVATNEDLLAKSGTSGFREDLFFRLSEFVLKVPALRERKVDLPLFIDFFLKGTSEELGREVPNISQEVLDHLYDYPWPGNIRELKNVLRRACLFISSDNCIYTDALPNRILQYSLEEFYQDHAGVGTGDNSISYDGQTVSLPTSSGNVSYLMNDSHAHADLKSTALQAESKRIIEVLQKVHFNKTKAAEILNIHRKTLYTKLKLMNIPY
jgi:two-component system, NtrC family, response regulator HydG